MAGWPGVNADVNVNGGNGGHGIYISPTGYISYLRNCGSFAGGGGGGGGGGYVNVSFAGGGGGGNGGYSVYNLGTITTLANAQCYKSTGYGPLFYYGNLPEKYEIIINDIDKYGQFYYAPKNISFDNVKINIEMPEHLLHHHKTYVFSGTLKM